MSRFYRARRSEGTGLSLEAEMVGIAKVAIMKTIQKCKTCNSMETMADVRYTRHRH